MSVWNSEGDPVDPYDDDGELEKPTQKPTQLAPVHKRRLLKLAKFMREEVPNRLLVMSYYLGMDDKGHHHRRASVECGTSACVAGWATAIFHELYFDHINQDLRMVGLRVPNDHLNSTDYTLEFFFGTSSEKIFGADDKTPKRAASDIERFVARGLST